MNDVTIKHGLAPEHRGKAAELYYTAFYQKLHPIFRDEARGQAVIEQSLQPEYAIVAMMNGTLVGIAGFKDSNGSLLDIQPKTVTDVYGFFSGWLRLLALSIFSREKQENTLLMDGIVVDSQVRGHGIGSQLLDAMIAHARTSGYPQVRLDVVDTNPRARQLYERKGFVPTKSANYPYLKRIFGFSGATTMLKTV